MSFKFYGFLLLQLFMLISAFDLDDKRKSKLEEIIKSQMKNANLHTMGIVIINETDTIFQNIFGEDAKANNQTRFTIGSVSKSFTALSVLKLNISLNQTLDKFDLGDYLDEDLLKEITISELLNHTSGLASFDSSNLTTRGTFKYSNYGFGLLGKIIEKVSNKKYSEYLKEEIFVPLNMTNTRAEYDDSVIESYDNFLGSMTKFTSGESEANENKGFYIPAGYISTSIEDMGNYLRFYLNESNADYVSNMTACGVETGDNQCYGMGMYINYGTNKTIYYHLGGATSFASKLVIIPQLNLSYFLVINTNDLLCLEPLFQFCAAIENFLLYDVYDEVDTTLHFYTHFTLDLIYFFIISIPITYLVITVVRKVKRKKYTWFIDVKGKIIFGVDVFVLCILPIIILICCYGIDGDISHLCTYIKDLLFTIITVCVALWLNFIIKIVYMILYIKLKWEPTETKVENKLNSSLQELTIKEDNEIDNDNDS